MTLMTLGVYQLQILPQVHEDTFRCIYFYYIQATRSGPLLDYGRSSVTG